MPDPTPPAVVLIPTAEIDADALPRDRGALEPEALAELQSSILANGLRQPVEVYELPDPVAPRGGGPTLRYGLISGFRRLAAMRAVAAMGVPGRDVIAAFVRAPDGFAAALAAMVEENAVRADVSAWDQGRIAVAARDGEAYPTIEAAVDGLYAAANKHRRSRLRMAAHVVDELDGAFTAPETLSQSQILRIGKALAAGFGEVIRTALDETKLREPAAQWALVLPYLGEAEEAAPERPTRPNRPRRVVRPRHGLTIRRERTREGWSLHFTGRDATGMMMDSVLDNIEQMYQP